MKPVTHYLKTIALLCLLGATWSSKAQSPCQASFNAYYGNNGSVTFYANAVGYSSMTPATFSWSYGVPGAASSSSIGMGMYTYTTNGVYTVTLVYVNAANTCTSTVTQTIQITNTANACGLNAIYAAITQSANGGAAFNSISTGTNGTSTYVWNFGDGGTATGISTTHTYSANGVYNGYLVVNNASPACTDTAYFSLNVNSFCAGITANFNYTQNNSLLSFTSTSSGPSLGSAYIWDFGDGIMTWGSAQVTHNYAATGTYSVILTATSNSSLSGGVPVCTDTIMQVVTINSVVIPCSASAMFTVVPTGTAQVWNVVPGFPTGNVTGAQWSWGDGSTSSSLFATHNYSAAGMYSICLTVTVNCGATASWCIFQNIYRSSQDMNMISVNVVNPNVATAINTTEPEQLGYSISPNPNNGSFQVSLSGLGEGKASISVYNLVGKLVYQTEHSGNGVKNVQLNDTANGVYFVKVASNNKVITKKVIVNGQ